MTRMLRRAIQSTLVFAVLAIGCSKPGSEFVGKWVNSGNTSDTLQIARSSGDQFTVTGPDNSSMNATYNNGTLQVPGTMGALTLTYVKSSDSLTSPGILGQVEYKRAK